MRKVFAAVISKLMAKTKFIKLGCILLSIFFIVQASNLNAQQDPNYSDLNIWICHPGKNDDACDRDLSTSVIAADGSVMIQQSLENSPSSVDCFYVYPTTSLDKTGNSDLVADEQGELNTAYLQAARFRSQCRVFSPLYRQITISAVRGEVRGNWQTAYGDVLTAWNYYLENENKGRGVVLIGHSQGASILRNLIAREVDGKPIQKQLVSALLIGTPGQSAVTPRGESIVVPVGKTVGGTFKNIPLCEHAKQTACVIAFASYRDRIPPPTGTAMFSSGGEGTVAVCTNPAALSGGEGELHAHLATRGEISLTVQPYPEWVKGKSIDTPFASLPGMLYAE